MYIVTTPQDDKPFLAAGYDSAIEAIKDLHGELHGVIHTINDGNHRIEFADSDMMDFDYYMTPVNQIHTNGKEKPNELQEVFV